MRLVKASIFASQLGIPRRTVNHWLTQIPGLGIKIKGVNWIRLDSLSRLSSIGIECAYSLEMQRWVKAVDLAKQTDLHRTTVWRWCAKNQRFAKRVSKIWYIDIIEFAKQRT